MTWLLYLLFSLSSINAIELPKEELANESVLPVFPSPTAVKNRLVSLNEKYEFGVTGGVDLNEPFFSLINFGGSLAYNFDEKKAVFLNFQYWMKKDTTFKQQLENDNLLILEGAPRFEYMLMANYQYTPFYGKMSLTKSTVSNFHLFTNIGAGLVAIGGQMNPALSLGLGQKFYFTPSVALRFDLMGLFVNGPDPLSVEITDTNNIPETSEYSKRLFMKSLLSASLVFVL